VVKGLFRAGGGQPNWAMLLATAAEIASGMEFLHGRGLVHGDLSGGNILLASSAANVHGFSAKVGRGGRRGGGVGVQKVQGTAPRLRLALRLALLAPAAPAWRGRRGGCPLRRPVLTGRGSGRECARARGPVAPQTGWRRACGAGACAG